MHILEKKSIFTKKDILERGVEEIIKKNNLKKRLTGSKKLRIKFGIDPTGSEIHLGHTVSLWKLRQFQDLGHKAILIIGDFTATIGDPSGRSKERKVLTDQETKKNMKLYVEQAGKILDIKKTEVYYNSEWHKKEGLDVILRLARTTTLQQVIERADFKKRIESGGGITIIELLYPLFQAYDSVKVRADVEIGGTDQKFNLLMGRQIQRRFGQQEQDIMTLPLLLGTDGVRKMSKSLDNYIALKDKPKDMFGKIMSIRDSEIVDYWELITPIPFSRVERMKKNLPLGRELRDLKFKLAGSVTAMYWGEKTAQRVAEEFEEVFMKRQIPENIPEIKLSKNKMNMLELLVKTSFVSSKTEARHLIEQKGVYIDDKPVKEYDPEIPQKDFTLRVGRRKITKVVYK